MGTVIELKNPEKSMTCKLLTARKNLLGVLNETVLSSNNFRPDQLYQFEEERDPGDQKKAQRKKRLGKDIEPPDLSDLVRSEYFGDNLPNTKTQYLH